MAFRIAEGYVEVRADNSNLGSDVERGADAASGSADKAGSKLGKKLVQGIGAAIVAGGIADTIGSAMDFSAGNSLMQAQLGLTTEQASVAGEIAGSLYSNNFGESMANVQDGVAAVISSIDGMDTANSDAVESMTGKLLNLEKAFGIDVGRSAQVAGQMVKSGLAGDAVEAVDLLTKTLQSVPAAVREDVLDAVDEYGPFMDQLGIKGADAMGLLVDASAKGMFGIDKTGDALKEFSIRATDMSASSGAAYAALGMDQQKMSNAILAGGETASEAFGEIVAGLGDIQDPAAQSAAAIALFGTPVEDLGTKDLPKFLDSLWQTGDGLKGVKGSADELGATLADNAGAKVDSSRRAIESWAQSLVTTKGPMGDILAHAAALGPEAIKTGAAFVTAGSGLLDFGKWLIPNTAKLATQTAAMVASKAESAALAAMYGKDMVVALAKNTAAMAKNGAVAVATGAKSAALGAAQLAMKAPMLAAAAITGVVTAAQWAWNLAMTANPIGLIILAIVALIGIIVALVMNWDSVVSFLTTVWEGFVSWFTGVMDGFLAWWNGLWTAIGVWIIQTWEGFVGFVTGIFNNFLLGIRIIGDTLVGWWNGLWTGLGLWIIETWNGFVGFVTGIFNNFMLGLQVIGNALSSWWSSLWTGFGRFVGDAIANVQGGFNAFIGFIGGIPKAIGDGLAGVGSFLIDAFKGPLNFIAGMWNDTLGSLSVTIPDWVPGLGGQKWSVPKMPYLAKGGEVTGAGSVMVGEQGPEILNLPRGASVVPLSKAGTHGSGSGGDTYNVTINEAEDPLGTEGRIKKAFRKWKAA